MKTIAVIEDDIDIGSIIEAALTKEHYRVLRAYSGSEAVYLLEKQTPDLILLDLMLPGLTGEELLPLISGIPVIVVSAKVGIDDKVNALMSGAADYITKPFSVRELVARVAVRLRESERDKASPVLVYGDLTLNTLSHEVAVSGTPVKLTKTEYALLKLLMQHPGQALAKSAMLERIAADTPDCTESSLKQHISNLRKKLRDVSGSDYIEAVWGIGFVLRLRLVNKE